MTTSAPATARRTRVGPGDVGSGELGLAQIAGLPDMGAAFDGSRSAIRTRAPALQQLGRDIAPDEAAAPEQGDERRSLGRCGWTKGWALGLIIAVPLAGGGDAVRRA